MTTSTADSFIVVTSKSLPTTGFSTHVAKGATSLVQPGWDSFLKSLSTSTVAGLVAIASNVAFVPTEAPTAPLPFTSSPIIQSPISAVLASYETGNLDLAHGQRLLTTDRDVFAFLAWFPRAVREIYGEQAKISLRTVDDLETGAQVVEARVLSGMELGDEFDSKDAKLFEKIEYEGIETNNKKPENSPIEQKAAACAATVCSR